MGKFAKRGYTLFNLTSRALLTNITVKKQPIMRHAILIVSLIPSLCFLGCANESKLGSSSLAPTTVTQSVIELEGKQANTKTDLPSVQLNLVKKAQLTLVIENIDQTIQAITRLIRTQQGDILNLEKLYPTEPGSRQTASLSIRIPQQQLDDVLTQLTKLGVVRQQSQTAEDVSSQLVDFKARLRNLRRSEEMLLQIMGRSGSVGDVLKVSQELSGVRESIEQIDGQLTNLQSQVTYSTITIALEQQTITTPFQKHPGGILVESWTTATRSVVDFTLGLAQLTLWILAYSPYLLITGGGVYWIKTRYLPRLKGKSPSSVHHSQSEGKP